MIPDFAERRGYAPTLREIGTAAGLSSTSSSSLKDLDPQVLKIALPVPLLYRTPGTQ
jgi:hypothetical protein